jgi:CheY-like chemotaxis protein
VAAGQEDPVFAGRRILVVEDEMLLMMMLQDILEELGCTVVAASRVGTAVVIAETQAIDGAILDVNVAGETVEPVAQILKRREIPIIFSTGYDERSLPLEYRDVPLLSKPYLSHSVQRALAKACR